MAASRNGRSGNVEKLLQYKAEVDMQDNVGTVHSLNMMCIIIIDFLPFPINRVAGRVLWLQYGMGMKRLPSN